ncbi:type II toxin-antitoxin system YafQ family toxin [Candidatus Pantoea communis]|uniref:type II toxin-antitoxin system YafQ family toxin n=1 Tax=Pantoea TaxID=53335 RepID=UPI0034E1EDDE
MKKVVETKKFEKEFKKMIKRGKDPKKLFTFVRLLANESYPLPEHYRDHPLKQFKDVRDAHIEPDWVLFYRVTTKEVELIRTGTHSDLF